MYDTIFFNIMSLVHTLNTCQYDVILKTRFMNAQGNKADAL